MTGFDPNTRTAWPAPETAMRRPDGVVANAPSEARMALASIPTMTLKGSMEHSRRPAARAGAESRDRLRCGRSPHRHYYALEPQMHNAPVLGLTVDQMMQITGCRKQMENCAQEPWEYDHRWEAQPILDFLYLGPSKMATNRHFLVSHGISKMIAIRDSRFADARMLVYDKVASSLGIDMECFDVPTTNALVTEIPRAVDSINRHMLSAPTDAQGASTGKVFVFCETGNIRSAAVVLAYIMSMYGVSMQDSWKFATLMRFCICLDEDVQQMLVSYEQLFQARLDVQAEQDRVAAIAGAGRTPSTSDTDMAILPSVEHVPPSEAITPSWPSGGGLPGAPHGHVDATLHVPRPGHMKRSIEETVDADDDRVEYTRAGPLGAPSREPSSGRSTLNLDFARYENRGKFVPFVDTSTLPAK